MLLRKTGCFLYYFLLSLSLNAFTQNPYAINGDATQDNCHCYTLTPAKLKQSGSIWNKNKIDLTQPFNYNFNVFLGCLDTSGADGIVFVLQPVSTSLGSAGEGIGFGGIVPSLGVTIDTYQNFNDDDPAYDHVAIQANGDVVHSSPNNLAGPVKALANSDNIEDCKWHLLNINWQPSKQVLDVSIDGSKRLSLHKDIIGTLFQNNPLVYWGFTAATGDSLNLQQVCTALNAKYILAPHANTCIGTPLMFIDSSVSFGSITNWYWDLGDGSKYNIKNPLAHVYSSAGLYNVKLNIEGNDGCVSDTFKQEVTIGTYPVADFKISPSPICPNTAVSFLDTATLLVGTENYWSWDLGNGMKSNEQNPPAQLYNTGIYPVTFIVKSTEGCIDTVEKNIIVEQLLSIDFTTSGACKDLPVQLNAENSYNATGIKKWYWNFGDNNFSGRQNVSHIYTNGGDYNVRLVAEDNNGCITDTISKQLKIYATNAYAGADTTIFINTSYQLNATGGDSYVWSPSSGLSNPFIANPTVNLQNDATYILTALNVAGCSTNDTLHLKVQKGPEIYVPTAFTPNGDGVNDRFKIFPVGIARINAFGIYNRTGQRIYFSLNASEGWDGSLNGIVQPEGTYVWFVTATTFEGKEMKKQGTVVLIR